MPVRRALFVNPPLTLGRDFIDYPWFADLGLLWAAGRACRAGWDVHVTDAFALPGAGRAERSDGTIALGAGTGAVLEALPAASPDLVVIGSSPFLRPWDPDAGTVALVDGLRARYPAAALVLADCHVGGMHAVDFDGRVALARLGALDAVLRHAGESWLDDPGRMLALRGSRSVVGEAAGASWPPSGPPFPAYEALDPVLWGGFLWRCFAEGRWANPFGVDATTRPFLASTGCPHRCVFCSSNPGWRPTGRKPYRAVPLDVVHDWAFLLVRALGTRRLFVMDDVANQRPDFEGLLDVFERLDVAYEFPNGLRADRLSDEAIRRMKDRVGLLAVSAESGTQEDLAGPVGKHLDLAEVERVAATAHAAGVPLLVHWIVGFPWETPAHVQRTLARASRLWERYGATPAVQFATPLPGTALHDRCVAEGLVPAGMPDLRDGGLFQHRPAFRPPALPEGFLERARGSLDERVAAGRDRKVIVNLTYNCINQCVFCAVSGRVRRDLPWKRLGEVLREHRARGTELVDFDGGEPTLYPRLRDAIRRAARLGYRQINLTTNGRRLADPKFARLLLKTPLTSLLISLHGPTPEIHDALTGVPGSFAETLAGLRNAVAMKAAATDLGVNVTVAKGNVDALAALAARVFDEGVRKLNLQLLTPFGSAGAAVVPDPDRAVAAVTAVLDAFGDRMALHVVNATFCRFPGRERFLSSDVQKLGRTMVFVTDEEVNLFAYLAGRRVRTAECDRCPHGLVCEGFFDFTAPPTQ